jgi:hypothetical protein
MKMIMMKTVLVKMNAMSDNFNASHYDKGSSCWSGVYLYSYHGDSCSSCNSCNFHDYDCSYSWNRGIHKSG